jgi:hypothetical protein
MPSLPALKSPATLASSEASASSLLSESLTKLVQSANQKGLVPPREVAAKPRASGQAAPSLASLSGPGISASGSHPNILSQEARYRLNRSAQLTGLFALCLVPITAAVLSRQGAAWSPVPVALSVAALGLFVIAYFTVMGFGNVSVEMQLGSAPRSADSNGSGNDQEAKPVAGVPKKNSAAS